MKAVKNTNITIIHESKDVDNNKARMTRIFSLVTPTVTKKFKMIYRLENGSSDCNIYIMNSDGEFKMVLDKHDLGHKFACSYVSYPQDKEKDITNAVKLVDSVVAKVYN
jgi:hypothetical protein